MKIKDLLLTFLALWGILGNASAELTQQDGWYLINNASDWSYFCTQGETYKDKQIKLMADISSIITQAFTEEFTGTFDGGGHKIYVNISTTKDAGLFSKTNTGAIIKNFTITGSVSGNYQVGVVGYANGCSLVLQNIDTQLNITAGQNAGGLVGAVERNCVATFLNCVVSGGDIKQTESGHGVGGIVGWMSGEGAGMISLYNCAMLAKSITRAGTNGMAQMLRINGNSRYVTKNCYYKKVADTEAVNSGWAMPSNEVPIKLENCSIIKSFEDLKTFRDKVNAGQGNSNAILFNDINMNNEAFATIGFYTDKDNKSYTGVFDGWGHELSNVNVEPIITDVVYHDIGLFGRVATGGKIKNLGLNNVSARSETNNRCGGIVGELHNSQMMNCYVIGTVTLNTTHAQKGSLVGEAASGTLTNCYSTNTTYNLVGGQGTKNNCYGIGEKSLPSSITSGELCYLLNGQSSLDPIFYQKVDSDYPRLLSNVDMLSNAVVYTTKNNGTIVSYNNNVSIDEGVDKVYISNFAELQAFADAVSKGGRTSLNAELTADIQFPRYAEWAPIGYKAGGTGSAPGYAGTFDGKGHKITLELYYLDDFRNCLIYKLGADGEVKDLIVDGNIQTIEKFVGPIACDCYGHIHNCVSWVAIQSDVNGDGTHGGFVARQLLESGKESKSCIEDCAFYGSIASPKDKRTNHCGGIVGWSGRNGGDVTGIIQNCIVAAHFDLNSGNNAAISRVTNDNNRPCTNCYYWITGNTVINQTNTATQEKHSALVNGEACWNLNGNSRRGANSVWHQQFGRDPYPLPFKNSDGVVYKNLKCKDSETLAYTNSNVGQVTIPTNGSGFYAPATAEHLLMYAQAANAGIITTGTQLAADIDMTAYPYFHIGTEDHPLNTTFDGQSHKITLALHVPASIPGNTLDPRISGQEPRRLNQFGYTTLFRNLGNATYSQVQNLYVDGTITTASKYIGGIVGKMSGGKVERCVSSVNIVNEYSTNADATYGGVVSLMERGSIQDCAFYGSMTGVHALYCGGIVGWADGYASSLIKNCNVFADMNIGGGTANQAIVRITTNDTNKNNVSTENNHYYITGITPSSNQGEKKESLWGEYWGATCDALHHENTGIQNAWYQDLKHDLLPYPNAANAEQKKVYKNVKIGETAVAYSNSSAGKVFSANDYTDVANVDELLMFVNALNADENTSNHALKARLTNDLELDMIRSDKKSKWFPIGYKKSVNEFTGEIDGQGHTLDFHVEYNAIASQSDILGFIGYSESGVELKNIKFTGQIGDSNGYKFYGGSVNNDKVTNVGIIANALGALTVENATSNMSITGGGNVGGFVGAIDGGGHKTSGTLDYPIVKFTNCLFDGTAKATRTGEDWGSSAGIVGWATSCNVGGRNILSIGSVEAPENTSNRHQKVAFFRFKHNGQDSPTDDCCKFDTDDNPTANLFCKDGGDTYTYINGSHMNDGKSTPFANVSYQTSPQQRASGEVCWKLGSDPLEGRGGIDGIAKVWRQDLTSEAAPNIKWNGTAGDKETTQVVNDQLSIKAALGYTTLLPRTNETLPDGVTAYIITARDPKNGVLDIGNGTKQLKVNQPVLLKGDENSKSVYANLTNDEEIKVEGLLVGVKEKTTLTGSNNPKCYVLGSKNGRVAFYLVGSQTQNVSAYKAYLQLPPEMQAITAFYFDEDSETGIQTIFDESAQDGDEIYNLSGQRINQMQRGVNIINGKKVLK